jgi:cell division protein FtsW
VLLVLVLLPGVGSRVKGAQRWFRFLGLSLQPSELAKLTVPLLVCRLAAERSALRFDWRRGLLPTVAPVAVAVPLVLLQPDLGTSLFLVMGTAISLFVSGWPLRWFGLGLAVAGPALGATMLAKPYQLQRIKGFLETWQDWTQAPYHLKQSLVTLAAGGTWGTGIGRGGQKLSFLPEAHTDFVFAVIGEELGLVGGAGVLLLWGVLFLTGLRLLRRVEPGRFEHAAACTLLTQVVLQAVINVAVVTALVPPKGIPHPLLSYGGTNLVVTLTALGLLFSLTRPPTQNANQPT